MTTRLLLIEDDAALGRQMVDQLQRVGYSVRWMKEGQLLDADILRGVALVIVDLMLPGTYGMDIVKHLRTFSEVPVLVLSARNDTSDKVRALKLGADDYMTKPFWPDELVERLRARLRRPVLSREDTVEVGALRINKAKREVFVRGQPVEVTRLEFDLLDTLATRGGEAVTRRALVERVMDPDGDGDERTLDVHVSRLRKKLGDGVIETVWGIGYRLATGSA